MTLKIYTLEGSVISCQGEDEGVEKFLVKRGYKLEEFDLAEMMEEPPAEKPKKKVPAKKKTAKK